MASENIKVMVTLWDGDIYILEGYKSQAEAEAKLSLTDKVEMPNGDIIKTSAISKVQSRESYSFQSTQKSRHKKGQYISNGKWNDLNGSLGVDVCLDSVTGELLAISTKSTQNRLPSGK